MVKLPPDGRFVESFSCYLAPNTVNPHQLRRLLQDKLVVSFTRTVRESHIEGVFSFLVKQGVKVKVKSGS